MPRNIQLTDFEKGQIIGIEYESSKTVSHSGRLSIITPEDE
ncbi:2491_t:CDS:2 [Scutellospora calospora]|uniref:2491_t:CDS:1 n=1 Tax=Scutellospora calospora TaxID=85575 RepID=A0ACA9MDZ5_9GLOM|nr:2491_t:CDS:2 [Scutellospora calospora]